MNDLERSLADYATFLDERSLARSPDHTSEQHEGDVIMVETQARESETLGDNGNRSRRRRRSWVAAVAAAAAAIGLIVIATELFTNESTQVATVDDPEVDQPLPIVPPAVDDETPDPRPTPETAADEGVDEGVDVTVPETLDPVIDEYLTVATAFMDAFARQDFEEASRYLIQPGSGQAESFITMQLALSIDLLGDQVEWMRAVDWRIDVDTCTVVHPVPENTTIHCPFVYDTAWGRALGLEPYPGTFEIRISTGELFAEPFEEVDGIAITAVRETFPWETFLAEVIDPFKTWLEANHPDEVGSMFLPPNESLPRPELPKVWPETRDLWAQRTEEFVAEYG